MKYMGYGITQNTIVVKIETIQENYLQVGLVRIWFVVYDYLTLRKMVGTWLISNWNEK